MKKALLPIGSVLAVVSIVLTASGEVRAAPLSFDTGNVQCGVTTSIDVDVTNGTTQTIPGGTAILGGLGGFTGHYTAIAPGTTVSIEVTSPNAWACNGNATNLRLKTSAGTFILPATRETTMVKIQVPPIDDGDSGIHVEGDPYTQYRSCDAVDEGSTYGVEAWIETFPVPSGTKYYRFEGGLESPWISLSLSFLVPQHRNLSFWFEDDVCPGVTTPFSLTVDSSAGEDTSHGTVAPHWEIVSGTLNL